MTTIRDIFNAFAPEYLERFPNLPLAHRKAISATRNCRSGHYGHSLYQCQSCGGQHRVHHACGNRHCPQCQQHKTQQWLRHQLEKQLPAPYFLRFIGTNLPGFTGVLHTWGRQLHYHPHIHYIVPGGGLSMDRAEWRPSQANFFVPVKALSPIYRAVFKEQMQQAGLLACIDPQAWHIAWNVHSQARPNGHTAFKYLAPYVFKVAISNRRIVSLKGRTVTFSYRKPGSSRPRTTNLDALEFIRRFLQHVLPDGFMKVRHFGFMNASCATCTDAIRMMIARQHHSLFKPIHLANPTPFVASCPTCGAQMQLVMRLWTANRTFLDTA